MWKQPQDFFTYPSAFNWYLFRAFLQSHPGLEKKINEIIALESPFIFV